MRLIDADTIFNGAVYVCKGDAALEAVQDVINRIVHAPTVDIESLPQVQDLRRDLESAKAKANCYREEAYKWKKEHGKLRAEVDSANSTTSKRVRIVLSDLDDLVARKLDSTRKDWNYSGKYGNGFKDALLVVRSMIHAAKKREESNDD